MGGLSAYFGCRGAGGFNNSLPEASSGDGGFTVACISGCRGVIGFKVATRLRLEGSGFFGPFVLRGLF